MPKPSAMLAIDGGTPVRTKPWRENLTLGAEERRAARAVIAEGRLSLFEGSHAPEAPFSFWGGPHVQALEGAWCEAYGVAYAVSMNSATSGLIASVGALGLGYGDEVLVSPYTMTAAASCPLVYGALPIFADVDLATGSLDPRSVEARISPRTRAVIVVHQFGIPADMDGIMALARRHQLKVIEDCAQAHGARYRGRPVGTIGDIGVFSLNVNKTIQTGEGGVCVTNDAGIRRRLALIRNHGEAVVGAAGEEDLVNLVGFNFRMTELTAAIALEQLRKLNRLNHLRRALVEQLSASLAHYPGLVPPPRCSHASFGRPGCDTCESTYYVYPLRVMSATLGFTRGALAGALAAEGVPWSEGYAQPLYLQPLYQRKRAWKHGYPFAAPVNQAIRTNYEPGACPQAEALAGEQMLVNEYVRPPHTARDVRDIIRAFDKIMEARSGRGWPRASTTGQPALHAAICR